MTSSFSMAGQRWFPPVRAATKLLQSLSSTGLISKECELSFWTDQLKHKIVIRPLTSDISALSQIFIGDEFGMLGLETPHVCLDLGANVGCASIYFLNRWPSVRVIAVEADPANFPLLVQNLKPYGDRALPVLGAVADFNGHVSIERSSEGHWASRISSKFNSTQPSVPAFTLSDIISWCPIGSVDLIKMDIEGAETSVMAWMEDHLESFAGATFAVELHNEEARDLFEKLAKLADSPVSTFGEYYSFVLP